MFCCHGSLLYVMCVCCVSPLCNTHTHTHTLNQKYLGTFLFTLCLSDFSRLLTDMTATTLIACGVCVCGGVCRCVCVAQVYTLYLDVYVCLALSLSLTLSLSLSPPLVLRL